MAQMTDEELAEYIALKKMKNIIDSDGLPAIQDRDEHFPGAPYQEMPRRRRQPWEGVDISVPVRSTMHNSSAMRRLDYHAYNALRSTNHHGYHHTESTDPGRTNYRNDSHIINTCISGTKYLDEAREIIKKARRR